MHDRDIRAVSAAQKYQPGNIKKTRDRFDIPWHSHFRGAKRISTISPGVERLFERKGAMAFLYSSDYVGISISVIAIYSDHSQAHERAPWLQGWKGGSTIISSLYSISTLTKESAPSDYNRHILRDQSHKPSQPNKAKKKSPAPAGLEPTTLTSVRAEGQKHSPPQ